MTNDKLERVARAICEANFRQQGCEGEFGSVDDCWFAWKDEAAAAIAACEAEAGEPTEAMIEAGKAVLYADQVGPARDLVADIYIAMRRAALNATAGEGEVG